MTQQPHDLDITLPLALLGLRRRRELTLRTTGDKVLDRIRDALRGAAGPLTRKEIGRKLGGRVRREKVQEALVMLRDAGLIDVERHPTPGRAAEVWRWTLHDVALSVEPTSNPGLSATYCVTAPAVRATEAPTPAEMERNHRLALRVMVCRQVSQYGRKAGIYGDSMPLARAVSVEIEPAGEDGMVRVHVKTQTPPTQPSRRGPGLEDITGLVLDALTGIAFAEGAVVASIHVGPAQAPQQPDAADEVDAAS